MKLSRMEIKELVRLDALCFRPPVNYSFTDLRYYTSKNEAILIKRKAGDELIAYCLGNAANGEIVTIDVHPDHRREGMGRELLGEMLEQFRKKKVPEAISQIALDNLPSIKLHEKFGFKITAILHGYYLDGSSAYEMKLILD